MSFIMLVCYVLTIGGNAMLQTVELPTGVTNLDSGLTNVDAETLSHDDVTNARVKCPRVTCSISPTTSL